MDNLEIRHMNFDDFKKNSGLPAEIVFALKNDRCAVDKYIAKRIAGMFNQYWRVWLQLYKNIERREK